MSWLNDERLGAFVSNVSLSAGGNIQLVSVIAVLIISTKMCLYISIFVQM